MTLIQRIDALQTLFENFASSLGSVFATVGAKLNSLQASKLETSTFDIFQSSVSATINDTITTSFDDFMTNTLPGVISSEVSNAVVTNPVIAGLISSLTALVGSVVTTIGSYFSYTFTAPSIEANALLFGSASLAGLTLEDKFYVVQFTNAGEVVFTDPLTGTPVSLVVSTSDALQLKFQGGQVVSVQHHDVDVANPEILSPIPDLAGLFNAQLGAFPDLQI